MAEGKNLVVSGKRKTAIARAVIKPGTGNITVNNVNYENLSSLRKLRIAEPLRIAGRHEKPNFDISVKIKGGGEESQIEAARLAIARAILAYTKSEQIKRAFLNYDRSLLIADTRRKETRKPGDSKARKKRQKSYR